jgi:hypothetical protein
MEDGITIGIITGITIGMKGIITGLIYINVCIYKI